MPQWSGKLTYVTDKFRSWPTTAISTVEFDVIWITALHHTTERQPANSLVAEFDPKGTFRTQVASGKSVVTLITSIASSE
jgi:hypothetical protein